MIQRRTRVGAAVLGSLAVAGLALSQAAPVHADPAAQAGDVVGVGSDIIQNSVNFLADGYAGLPGYNTAGNRHRVFNYDATGDANSRNAFTDPALGTAENLNATVVVRGGTSPIRRPNGGGKGITALLNDGDPTNGNRIQFARTPNALSATQKSTALGTGGIGSYRTIQFAKDVQYVATATTTNAPPALSVADLAWIYTHSGATWAQLKAGVSDLGSWTPPAPNATIVPLLPQDGAGVQQVFLKALGLWSSGSKASTVNWVQQVKQNDPTTITTLSAEEKPNALVPFPQGRYTLLNDHYFYPATKTEAIAAGTGTADPGDYNSANLGTPLGTGGIALQTGTGAFKTDIRYLVVFRESDATSTTPWQPGSTLNWVQSLFYNEDYDADSTSNTVLPPYVQSPAGKQILTQLGLTPTYKDFGTDYTE
ncbi:hypothetical protein [Nocardioides sp.]|uniref:hypothetical protein n=1 Tax=Nocardioides sp. TaxID=35761 RepID=UPI00261D2BF7|nr:hypothetical protein [Nocardioides sp.]